MKVNHSIENVLGDGIGKITLLEYMGGDLEIVDRARKCYQSQEKSNPESDARLLKKLVGSKPLHGTTMRGTVMTFDVIAPIFVKTQWTRHLIGHDTHGNDVWYTGPDSFDISGAYDEQSFRYTDKIQFYTPKGMTVEQAAQWRDMISYQRHMYNMHRTNKLPKQLARCALGPAVYSVFETTMNLQGFFDWYAKRRPGGGAQAETVAYAVAAMQLVRNVVPMAVEAWEGAQ
jgi:flavin-dependent thymidylate synthase